VASETPILKYLLVSWLLVGRIIGELRLNFSKCYAKILSCWPDSIEWARV